MNSTHLLSVLALGLAFGTAPRTTEPPTAPSEDTSLEPSNEPPSTDASEAASYPAIIPPKGEDAAFDAGAAYGKQCKLCRLACIRGPKPVKPQEPWNGSSVVSDPACGQNRPRCDEGIAYGWDESHKDQPEEVKRCYEAESPKMMTMPQDREGPPPIGSCSRCDMTSGDGLVGIGLLALAGLAVRRRRPLPPRTSSGSAPSDTSCRDEPTQNLTR